MATSENPHQGHRLRMKDKIRNNGFSGFSDHEVLEVLLYFSISRGNTNTIGHALLQRFGSLSGVLNASVAELCEIPGMGESSALLLRTATELTKRFCMEEATDSRLQFDSIHQLYYHLSAQFIGEHREVVYVMGVNGQFRKLFCELVSQGTVDFCHLDVRDLVELSFRYQANHLILAHNHPQGMAAPSREDMVTTRLIENTLHGLRITLYDHLIVANQQFYSFRQQGDLIYADQSR